MRVPNKIHINNYLIGGDLKPWNGEKAEIFSVIKIIIIYLLYWEVFKLR